jgi:hypothetical protein
MENENTEEIWSDIPGWPGYQVSSLGRLTGRRGKLISGSRDKDGYAILTLGTRTPEVRTLKVHRLVYEAFVGPIERGLMINHLNGIKDDNRVENLETTDNRGNQLHSFRTLGRKGANTRPARGEKQGSAKLTENQVREIRARNKAGESCYKMAKDYPVDKQTLQRICYGRGWLHVT